MTCFCFGSFIHWLVAPSSSPKPEAQSRVLLMLPPLWFSLLASSLTYKDLCDYIGPSRIMSSQDQLISKLNPICNFTSSLPCNLICSQVPGTRARISLGGWGDSVLLTTVRPSFSQLAQSILLATVFGVQLQAQSLILVYSHWYSHRVYSQSNQSECQLQLGTLGLSLSFQTCPSQCSSQQLATWAIEQLKCKQCD